MRSYGSVHTKFWINSDIHLLSNNAKLIALYLLTSPHTNMLGCFRLPIGYVVEDLQLDKQTIIKCFAELEKISFIKRDHDTGWTLIINFLEWNEIENPNQAKSIIKLFAQIPESISIFEDLISVLQHYQKEFDEAFQNRLATLSKGLAKSYKTLLEPLRNQEQEQEQEQEHEQEQKQGHTICAERCLSKNRDEAGSIQQAAITIPLNNNYEFEIFSDQIDQWTKLYPAVDILQELRNIRGWNLANPNRRKTKSGIIKHINSWLAKAQNNSHTLHVRAPPSEHKSLLAYNKAIASEWLNKTSITEEKIIT